MDYSKTYDRLRSFVREIYQYYAACNNLVNGQLVINKAMVRYVLPELSDEDIKTLYRIMMDETFITRADADTLTFSEAFYKRNYHPGTSGIEH
jgi:hypothetical protein